MYADRVFFSVSHDRWRKRLEWEAQCSLIWTASSWMAYTSPAFQRQCTNNSSNVMHMYSQQLLRLIVVLCLSQVTPCCSAFRPQLFGYRPQNVVKNTQDEVFVIPGMFQSYNYWMWNDFVGFANSIDAWHVWCYHASVIFNTHRNSHGVKTCFCLTSVHWEGKWFICKPIILLEHKFLDHSLSQEIHLQVCKMYEPVV